MLVLARKVGETIQVGEDIFITVLEDRKARGIAIGVDAPRDVPIHRLEVARRIEAERTEQRVAPGAAG